VSFEDEKTGPVGVRFPPEEKRALARAAAADDRPVAAFVRKIVRDRLRETGHLEASAIR
jgi:hypothetical protein